MTVKKKPNSNFVRWNKTQLKSSSSSVVDVGKKSTWWVAFLLYKATTRSTSSGRNFVALSFLVNEQYFKDYHKILGTLRLDHVGVSLPQWIHIVECIALFVKRIADWSVQKARTAVVRRGEKIQFDGFYLTRGHYSSGATFHDAKTGKIILPTLRTNVSCLSVLANNA